VENTTRWAKSAFESYKSEKVAKSFKLTTPCRGKIMKKKFPYSKHQKMESELI